VAPDDAVVSTRAEEVTACAGPDTVDGIDVSVYQGTIDWEEVRASGIEFAFIRTSHGTNTLDSRFDDNWAGAKAAGVLRGPYQYFESGQDAIAQADVMLARLSDYGPGDLPPVIDVEDPTNTPNPQAYLAKVGDWMDYVENALGVRPIIYTGKYYWQDKLANSSDFAGDLLWLAHYTSGCPNTPDAWSEWAFWQYSSTGSIPGISGNVDRNVFGGSLDDLLALAGQGECGDNICSPAESSDECPSDCMPCAIIEDEAVLDESGACFSIGGNPMYMREVESGWDDSMLWTHTIDADSDANYGEWELYFAEAGRYGVEVYLPDEHSQSTRAGYLLTHAGGETEIEIDQSQDKGWISLGVFDFAAGSQSLHLGDNTGEPGADEVELAFDAVRVRRVDDGEDEGDGDDGGAGVVTTSPSPRDEQLSGGCSTSGSDGRAAGVLWLVALMLTTRRRRRARP
jgi:MYXO-CTERM domain-containing protein